MQELCIVDRRIGVGECDRAEVDIRRDRRDAIVRGHWRCDRQDDRSQDDDWRKTSILSPRPSTSASINSSAWSRSRRAKNPRTFSSCASSSRSRSFRLARATPCSSTSTLYFRSTADPAPARAEPRQPRQSPQSSQQSMQRWLPSGFREYPPSLSTITRPQPPQCVGSYEGGISSFSKFHLFVPYQTYISSGHVFGQTSQDFQSPACFSLWYAPHQREAAVLYQAARLRDYRPVRQQGRADYPPTTLRLRQMLAQPPAQLTTSTDGAPLSSH
jgi:hypothetical protein